ncbi:hypothetical protein [Streptomyces sp.]|uniref:hypothetical protein n=1 Tax=Streptomyces sp. TaxID=1931 RepID=UPI002811323A|nr:hypothetical protein [Streptomyces sp.]
MFRTAARAHTACAAPAVARRGPLLTTLLGLVLGLLLCAAPVPYGDLGAGPARVPYEVSGTEAAAVVPGASGTAVTAVAYGTGGVSVPDGDGPVPGCGHRNPAEAGAEGPAVPPRAQGFAELLPALTTGRAPAAGAWGADPEAGRPAPGREPPELVPPSPVELSVLRV